MYVPIQSHLSHKPVITTKPRTNNTTKFCAQCDTYQPMDAIYCVKCGNRLVS